MFWALVRRDLKLAARIGGGGSMGLVFFLSLVTVMPFAVGPDLNLLARIGAAILWVAAMLATLLGLDRIFQAEEEDGSLDLLMMSPLPLPLTGWRGIFGVLAVGSLMALAISARVLGESIRQRDPAATDPRRQFEIPPDERPEHQLTLPRTRERVGMPSGSCVAAIMIPPESR